MAAVEAGSGVRLQMEEEASFVTASAQHIPLGKRLGRIGLI
jgi:hypothetical protein